MSYDIHSNDYKKLVIEHYLINGSLRKTCELFKCNKSTLYDWIVNDINKQSRKKTETNIFENTKRFYC
jgi:transposase-like protein